jgi:hypothetical protein
MVCCSCSRAECSVFAHLLQVFTNIGCMELFYTQVTHSSALTEQQTATTT